MEFVINEWMLDYFLPNATKQERELQMRFLKRFFERGDRLIILSPSDFTTKLESIASLHQNNNDVYQRIKFFITDVLRKPMRTTVISSTDMLPEATYAALHALGTNYKSDEYLFRAAMRTESKRIITRDGKLCNAMAGDAVFDVVLLVDFLKDY